MKKIIYCLFVLIALQACTSADFKPQITITNKEVQKEVPEKITFPSLDSLPITANLYHKNNEAPVIVLCHQARFNKYEYNGIAKKLMAKGFNCLAIDQRSGGGIVEEINETNQEAKKRNLPVDFLDAKQDIIAAINFASAKYGKPVTLWGSSYSSALALYIGCENKNVKAIIAFSPGNYFDKELGELLKKIEKCEKPMWLTSSKEEAPELKKMLGNLKLKKNQMQFVPDSAGFHGSRALWLSSENNEEYWKAVNEFLEKVK